MSTVIIAVPVTSHIHLFQQQLFWISRWAMAHSDIQIHFFVDEPHPTIQSLLLLFQEVYECQIHNYPETSIFEWGRNSQLSFLILEPGAIPHPHLLDALLRCQSSIRLEYCGQKHTAARWFPNNDVLTEKPNDDDMRELDSSPYARLAAHDADWLKWAVLQEEADIHIALMLIRIFSFDHADVDGKEGNQFLSEELKSRLSNRQKAVSKIKSSHTNMILHPVHVEVLADGRYKVFAVQEIMRMGGAQSKAAVFFVTTENGFIHHVQPKPIRLPDFPLSGAVLPEPVVFRPITIGQQHRLVFSTIMRNEGDKFLHEVISHAAQYVDAFLVIDDCSTDNSIEVCRDAAGSVPLYLYSPPQPLYVRSEFFIRSLQWALTAELKPEWVLLLDADEKFEDNVVHQMASILSSQEMRVGFPKFDMWNETHYRDDAFWCPHKRFWPHLIRYTPEFTSWHKAKVHSGRHPLDYLQLPVVKHPLRIKHLGWSLESERQRKHEWYLKIDERPNQGNADLYKHIADPNPVLKPWVESIS